MHLSDQCKGKDRFRIPTSPSYSIPDLSPHTPFTITHCATYVLICTWLFHTHDMLQAYLQLQPFIPYHINTNILRKLNFIQNFFPKLLVATRKNNVRVDIYWFSHVVEKIRMIVSVRNHGDEMKCKTCNF